MFERLRTAGLTAAAAFLCAVAPALADTVLECEIKQLSSNGAWLPEVVYVFREPGSDQAEVYDPVIDHFYGDSLPAKVETDNASRTTYVWKLKVKTGTNQNVRFNYRLTVMKADMTASISGDPLGYGETFQSRGTCKHTKMKG